MNGRTRHRCLVPADMVLRRHENQLRARFCRLGLRLRLRRAPTGMEDANDGEVSRKYADPDRSGYGEAEDQRHEERNHNRPPFSTSSRSAVIRCKSST
jgi:hypothetical protein